LSEENRMKYHLKKLDFKYLLGMQFPDLLIGKSKIHANGVIADEKIQKGKIIFPLVGILYNLKKAKIDFPKYSYQLTDNIAIETVTESGFMNHSCNPNAFINQDWMAESIVDIEKGEEITFDYGSLDYFDYSFECGCGSQNCRKKYSGKIAQNPEYRKANYKYFSPYLKEKF